MAVAVRVSISGLIKIRAVARSMTTPFRSLHVGIDGYNLALQRGTGIATYTRVLSHALAGMGASVDVLYGLNLPRSTSNSRMEDLFFDRLGKEESWSRGRFPRVSWWRETMRDLSHPAAALVPVTRHDRKKQIPSVDRILNIPGLFRRAAGHFKTTGRLLRIRIPHPPTLMHWTFPLPIMVDGIPNIYTVHDLVPLKFPHMVMGSKTFHFNLLNRLCMEADALCVVSEATRKDVLSFFPESEQKIHNSYQSIDINTLRGAQHHASQDMIRNELGLNPDEYFLFCGSIEPKKNIGRLVAAFLASESSRKLVISSAMSWKSENDVKLIERGVSLGRIQCLDYVSHATLQALMINARALLFPSITEGFGLPVLEAMALGAPVLTSNEGALAEITGGAALGVEPYSISAIEAAIMRLDHDDMLCAELRERGRARAEFFNLGRYQERLRSLYSATAGHLGKF
ncbi:glycosyltransferase family 4 protein [Acidomonas methanolica]|uniref:glycosyltransferase family 4 protein n=1 Tax=Acidomonas methanolica TaxID=437 RepID=UPI00211A767D|nr:glycosyltransferase family 1 protein [Acidomonas methanolica]